MAGNYGKYIDRSPNICAAGKTFGDINESVKNTFQEYPVVDKIQALEHDAHLWQKEEFVPPKNLPPISSRNLDGFYSQMRSVLQPNIQTRYQTLINELKETLYHSYWNEPVGQRRDPVPGLPKGTVPETVTFGKPTSRGPSMKELVSPPKTPYEVLYDSQIAHEWYRKTHNDYNPAERVNRMYEAPPYCEDKRYGRRYNYDPRGIGLKCTSMWIRTKPTMHCSKIRADFVQKNFCQFGKSSTPNNNADCVPEGHCYGNPTKWNLYDVKNLLKDPDVKPCLFKRDFLTWFQTLTALREKIKHLQNFIAFNFNDFSLKIIHYDENRTGTIPLKTLYEVCGCNRITFNRENMENLCKYYKLIEGDQIYYKQFLQLINPNNPLPEIKKFDDIPEKNQYYVSSYQAAGCDRYFTNNSDMPPAGKVSADFDKLTPVIPEGQCKADMENLDRDTTVKALISPNIFTTYGLTYRDMFKPRDAKTIRTIFEKSGYMFPNDTFDELWKKGVEHDETGLVCVDTFKNLLKCYYPEPNLHVHEEECMKK